MSNASNLKREIPNSATVNINISGDVNNVDHVKLHYDKVSESEPSHIEALLEVPNVNGNVTFELKNIRSCEKIRAIGIIYKKLTSNNTHYYDSFLEYVVSPGDKINIYIEVKDTMSEILSFEGDGARKYVCRESLRQLFEEWYYEKDEKQEIIRKKHFNGKNSTVYDENLISKMFSDANYVEAIHDRYINYRLRILDTLESYRNKLDPLVHAVLEADVLSQMDRYWELNIIDIYTRCEPKGRYHVAKLYLKNVRPLQVVSDQVLNRSYHYREMVYQRAQATLLIEGHYQMFNEIPFDKLSMYFKSQFSEGLRDWMFTLLLTDPKKQIPFSLIPKDVGIAYAKSLLTTISNPILRSKIRNSQIFKIKKDDIPFQFKLPDTLGKIVSLSDFQGEVILIEMWFTGCTGCSSFYRRFKTEIKPKLASEDFKIISINIDYEKEKWLKSIKTEQYTNSNNINLQLSQPRGKINDSQFDQFMKRYDITTNGLPFILLIGKNHKIVTQFSNYDSSEKIISIINAEL